VADLNIGPDGVPLPAAREDAAFRDRFLARVLGIQDDYFATPGTRCVGRRGSISLYGMRVELESCRWTAPSFTAEVTVPDRNTGAPLRLIFEERFDPCRSEEEWANAMIRGLAKFLAHELAEMLFIGGVRFDPHGRPAFFGEDERLIRPQRRGIGSLEFTARFDPESSGG